MDGYRCGETKRLVLDSMKFAWTISPFGIYLSGISQTLQPFESPKIESKNYVWTIEATVINTTGLKSHLGLRMSVKELSSTKTVQVIQSQYRVLKNGTDYYTKQYFNMNSPNYNHCNSFIAIDDLRANDSIQSSQKLTIFCEGIALGDYVHVLNPAFEVPSCRHLDKLGDLLETGILSDVTLVASGQAILAHKAILAAQSTVFAAMFERDMKEKQENLVNITDVDADVVREMLRYIYVGSTGKLKELALELHSVADKYNLAGLKAMCEVEMSSFFKATVANVLISADLRGAVELKKKAMEYIISNLAEVIITPGFKTIVESHPRLIAELFTNGVAQK